MKSQDVPDPLVTLLHNDTVIIISKPKQLNQDTNTLHNTWIEAFYFSLWNVTFNSLSMTISNSCQYIKLKVPCLKEKWGEL